MTGWKAGLKSEFVPEWCALALLALADIVWARQIGLHIAVTAQDFTLLAVALGAMAGLRLLTLRKGGLMAEYFGLTAASASAICVLSYLCLASAGPMLDSRLMAMDRALGFDWITGYRFVTAHAWLSKPLGWAYGSLCYQGLYFCVLLALMNRKDRLREMFWMVLLTGMLACIGALLVPAFGPSRLYNIGTDTGFMPSMEQLVRGENLNFALSKMAGVVSFPSFHTSMALAYVWAFHRTGIIGWIIAGLNVAMIAAVPWFGGHYLVDMIAGAATMLLSLALIRNFGRLKASAASAWPEFAARFAGAYSGGGRSR